jgi:hypothetical protein
VTHVLSRTASHMGSHGPLCSFPQRASSRGPWSSTIKNKARVKAPLILPRIESRSH